MAFSEYPKAMSHPGYRPAVLSKDEFINGKVIKAPPGSPAKFPPVYVNNHDQESYYSAMGYVPNGTADPEAYHAAMAGADKPNHHQHVEFPKYLYQKVADHKDAREGDVYVHDGECYVRPVLLKDQEAQDKLTGDWYATPGDAALADASPAEDETEETEEEAPGESDRGSQAQSRGRGRPRKE